MAAYNKISEFAQDVCQKLHNFATSSGDAFQAFLLNAAPAAADTVVDTTGGTLVIKSSSNSAEIAAGNGDVKGGIAITLTTTRQSAGPMTVAANQAVWTASGGAIGPFRYVCLFNNTTG